MFAEEQSDVQEFFLYLVEELAKEVESFAPSAEAVPIEDEDAWSEIGSGGRKVIIHEAIVKQNIVNSLFETQLRKESRSYSKRQLVEPAVLPDALAAHRLQLRRCAAGVRA